MFVETKRDGESVVQEPSVAGFRAWLEMQPREGTFYLYEPETCALGQYLKSLGRQVFEFQKENFPLYYTLEKFPCVAGCNIGDFPTFGDVLAEIERATTLKTAQRG